MLSPGEWHQINTSMAGDAANALIQMDAVIEVGEIRQVVDSRPGDGLAVAVALAHRLQHWAIGPDLEVTVHAGLGRRDTSKCRSLDRGMTVSAVDAKGVNVVLVAKLHGLWARHASLRDVRRALDHQQEPEEQGDEYDGAEDAHPGNGVG